MFYSAQNYCHPSTVSHLLTRYHLRLKITETRAFQPNPLPMKQRMILNTMLRTETLIPLVLPHRQRVTRWELYMGNLKYALYVVALQLIKNKGTAYRYADYGPTT